MQRENICGVKLYDYNDYNDYKGLLNHHNGNCGFEVGWTPTRDCLYVLSICIEYLYIFQIDMLNVDFSSGVIVFVNG